MSLNSFPSLRSLQAGRLSATGAFLLLAALAVPPGCARSPRAASPAPTGALPTINQPAAGRLPESQPIRSFEAARAAGRSPPEQVVRALAARDFKTRAQAARVLLQAGEAALPALGRAGELTVHVGGGVAVSATRPVIRSVLKHTSDERLPGHLESPFANVRRAAAAELGRRDRWDAVPALIGQLDDSDAGVRLAAAASLRRITNNFFGYRARAARCRRLATTQRWRTWWSLEGRAQARAQRGGGPLVSAQVPPAPRR